MPRQDVSLTGTAEQIAGLGLAYRPTSHSKARRDRGWEQRQRADPELCQVSYRGIPRWLNGALNEVAQRHRITVSEVARIFLEYAWEDYDHGLLEIVDAAGEPERIDHAASG